MNWVLNLFSTDFFSEEQDSSKLAAETTASPYPSPVPFTGGTILKSKDDPYLNADSAEQLRESCREKVQADLSYALSKGTVPGQQGGKH